jgi:hypothetical protein
MICIEYERYHEYWCSSTSDVFAYKQLHCAAGSTIRYCEVIQCTTCSHTFCNSVLLMFLAIIAAFTCRSQSSLTLVVASSLIRNLATLSCSSLISSVDPSVCSEYVARRITTAYQHNASSQTLSTQSSVNSYSLYLCWRSSYIYADCST